MSFFIFVNRASSEHYQSNNSISVSRHHYRCRYYDSRRHRHCHHLIFIQTHVNLCEKFLNNIWVLFNRHQLWQCISIPLSFMPNRKNKNANAFWSLSHTKLQKKKKKKTTKNCVAISKAASIIIATIIVLWNLLYCSGVFPKREQRKMNFFH